MAAGDSFSILRPNTCEDALLEVHQAGLETTMENAEEVTAAYLIEEGVPIYDPRGNRCPGSFGALSRAQRGHYECASFSRGRCTSWVLVYVRCPMCFDIPPTPEQQIRVCQANAQGQRDACLYKQHEDEVICRADARQEAFEFCQDPKNRQFVVPVGDLGFGIIMTDTIEGCIERRVGNRFRFTGDLTLTTAPTAPIEAGIKFTGPYDQCRRARVEAETPCFENFRRARENCDKCFKLTCP